MEYAFSFFVKDSLVAARGVHALGAPGATWETVRWDAAGAGAESAPPLARLALWAPGAFRVDLRLHAAAANGEKMVLGGRVWVRAAGASVPLPEHVRVARLLRSQAGCMFVELPGAAEHGGSRIPGAALWLPPTVYLGVSTGVVADVSAGLVHPAARASLGLGLACRGARWALRGAVLTVRGGGGVPAARFRAATAGRARVLVVTRPELLPQWERRVGSLKARVVTYADIHHFVQGPLLRLLRAPRVCQSFAYTLALLRSMHADVAPLVEREPLLELWCHTWDQVWMDEDTLCPAHVLAPCQHIAARWKWVVRAPATLTLHAMRAHARQLGLPDALIRSPWFPQQWSAHACFDIDADKEAPPAPRTDTTWLHLPRAWHAEYVTATSTLRRLAVCLGVARAPRLRLCASSAQALRHRGARARAKRKRDGAAAPPSLGFFRRQLGAPPPAACPVCLDGDASGAHAVVLRCGHRLCLGCARRLLQSAPRAQCPQCRASLSSVSSAYVVAGRAGPVDAAARAYGPKLACIARLLHDLEARQEAAVLVGQLPARCMRRVALLLRQLGLPCACAAAGRARFQAAEVRRFQAGACPRLLLAAHQMRGLELPAARHVVFLHAMVEERPVRPVSQWVARGAKLHPGGARHHRFPLRRTAEEALLRA